MWHLWGGSWVLGPIHIVNRTGVFRGLVVMMPPFVACSIDGFLMRDGRQRASWTHPCHNHGNVGISLTHTQTICPSVAPLPRKGVSLVLYPFIHGVCTDVRGALSSTPLNSNRRNVKIWHNDFPLVVLTGQKKSEHSPWHGMTV